MIDRVVYTSFLCVVVVVAIAQGDGRSSLIANLNYRLPCIIGITIVC